MKKLIIILMVFCFQGFGKAKAKTSVANPLRSSDCVFTYAELGIEYNPEHYRCNVSFNSYRITLDKRCSVIGDFYGDCLSSSPGVKRLSEKKCKKIKKFISKCNGIAKKKSKESQKKAEKNLEKIVDSLEI